MLLKAITSLKQLQRAVSKNITWEAQSHIYNGDFLEGQFILLRITLPYSEEWFYAKILSAGDRFVTIAEVLVDNSLSPKKQKLCVEFFDYFYLFEMVS